MGHTVETWFRWISLFETKTMQGEIAMENKGQATKKDLQKAIIFPFVFAVSFLYIVWRLVWIHTTQKIAMIRQASRYSQRRCAFSINSIAPSLSFKNAG